MANTNVEGMTRSILPVVYVIDTSGSMNDDGKIGTVNDAMREAVELLRDVSDDNANVEARVAVLQFATVARWEKPELVPLEDFFWNNLTAGGTTQFSRALEAIGEKFSSKQLFNSDVVYKMPVVIFMTDGEPTDPGEWEKKLEWLLSNNKWFQHSIKIAIAIGSQADRACLARLVGSSESIATVHDNESLKNLIKAVTIHTIMAGDTINTKNSGSNNSDSNNSGSDLGKDMMRIAVKEAEITTPDPFNDKPIDPITPPPSVDPSSYKDWAYED